MKKNVIIGVLAIILTATVIYSLSLQKQLAETKRKIESYSEDANYQAEQETIANEKYAEALAEEKLAKAKYENEQAEKKSKN